MAMLIFLLVVVGLGALMFAGYRLNMYLYTQGAMGTSSRMQPAFQDASPVEPVREVMESQDYGLRYARVGLLLIVGFLIIMAVALVTTLFGVLH
jgi:hypothetical protein